MPAALGGITSLTELYLGNNRLTSVPAELGGLTALKELSLYSNRLTSVPAELGELTALTKLELWSNPVTFDDLPDAVKALPGLRMDDPNNSGGDLSVFDYLLLFVFSGGNPLVFFSF